MQLCLSYAYGDGKAKSAENTANSISRILYVVPITKYFALDLNGIAHLNDDDCPMNDGVRLMSCAPNDEFHFRFSEN